MHRDLKQLRDDHDERPRHEKCETQNCQNVAACKRGRLFLRLFLPSLGRDAPSLLCCFSLSSSVVQSFNRTATHTHTHTHTHFDGTGCIRLTEPVNATLDRGKIWDNCNQQLPSQFESCSH